MKSEYLEVMDVYNNILMLYEDECNRKSMKMMMNEFATICG